MDRFSPLSPAAKCTAQPIHLLLTSLAATGHINPILQLAYCLIEPQPWKPPIYITLAIVMDPHVDGKVSLSDLESNERIRIVIRNEEEPMTWLNDFEKKTLETAEDFTPRVANEHLTWPPLSGVIADFVSFYGQRIAEHLKIPCFLFGASPLIFIYTLIKAEELTAQREQGAESFRVPGIGAFKFGPVPQPHIIELFKKFCKTCITTFQKSQGCLANDMACLYSPEFLQALPVPPLPPDWKLFCCGPLVIHDPRARKAVLRPAVQAFLDCWPERSVIYVAMGSVWNPQNQDLVELVRGIASTNRPFIFAFRGKTSKAYTEQFNPPDSAADEPTEADGLPVGFRTEVADRGLIVDWVNQPAVLQHQAVGAFITHCGWNSTVEALALAGVPLLLVPLQGDQFIVADLVADHLRCGKRIRSQKEKLDRVVIRNAIDSAFDDAEMRAQSSRLRSVVRQEGVTSSQSNLTELLSIFDSASKTGVFR
eukprot:Protomagalhaensia_wolfi_Nauph_80__673@NODE_1386_length_1553_cov_74_225231_g1072_i0_p1_GENE_NODE_1386_length_1553_cov_74_225231_g1072_i0NODE_1386_length_1553_cov_74_225231_g1072_i0_p1_ORF_typecomplete_len481_score77_50UDPGT/PF00201_18/1_2e38Glyco_tran_28_C/PF04101_16/9_7e06_NODE_1386_length_1553_cov_74_225231_g1072_i0611503